jgi:hypothetical protein
MVNASAGQYPLTLLAGMASYLRNDTVHGDGRASILGLASFLTSYENSLYAAQQGQRAGSEDKGKRKVKDGKQRNHSTMVSSPESARRKERCILPDEGWIKLNTDTDFCPNSGVASVGIIARDDMKV